MKIFLFNKNIFKHIILKMNTSSFSQNISAKLKQEEKFSIKEIKEIVDRFHSTNRMISLPSEFQLKEIENILVQMQENPREPYEEECCGASCNPCVWDTYDKKKRTV